jgi:hypothetical protein
VVNKQDLLEFKDEFKAEMRELMRVAEIGSAHLEAAYARFCRIIIEEQYAGKKIHDEVLGEDIIFTDQESFVGYVIRRLKLSRQTFFNRLGLYKTYIALQMTYPEAYKAALNAPGIAAKVSDVFELDRFTKEPRSINLDTALALAPLAADREKYIETIRDESVSMEDKLEEVIPLAKEKILELSELENRQEAARAWDETFARNSIRFRHNGHGEFHAYCTERSIDAETGEIATKEFEVQYAPSIEPPKWVADKLYSRLGAIEER